MNKETDPRILCEQLWANLPPPLPRERIQELYGDVIDRMVKQAAEALSRPTAADVVVSVLREAGSRVLKLVSHAADVVAEVLPALPGAGMQPAFATRSAAASPAPVREVRIEASRDCGSARLRVFVETVDSCEIVRVCLENGADQAPVPFNLTVIDEDAGKNLVDATRFESGEAILQDVAPGTYLLGVESDEAESFLVLRIESPER